MNCNLFFSFGYSQESNASALATLRSPTLQLWLFSGVQRFSFGYFQTLAVLL
ncbi:MAG: hypothetical protein KAI83_09875 [Thiomargarita sp.]|nr:hypothetical protein [Thiomargarita sp.]